jgi:hypothetical protein
MSSSGLENTPVPTIIVLAGIAFVLVALIGKSVKGFGFELEAIESTFNRYLLGVVGLALLTVGLWIGDNLPGRSETTEPSKSASPQSSNPTTPPRLPTTTEPRSSNSDLSPVETVSAYLRAMTARDFKSAQRLMPSLDVADARDWLEGRSTKSPIRSASLVSAKQVESGSSRVTVQGRVRFCRNDGSGTDERKSYGLALNDEGAWEIRISYDPAEVTSIRC